MRLTLDQQVRVLNGLNLKKHKALTRSALLSGARIIANGAKSNLKRDLVPRENRTKLSTSRRMKPSKYDDIVGGVRSSAAKSGLSAKAHVMGKKLSKGSKGKLYWSYMTKFFEKGTQRRGINPRPRKTKRRVKKWKAKTYRKHNTGQLKGIRFLKRSETDNTEKAYAKINDTMEKQIQKIFSNGK